MSTPSSSTEPDSAALGISSCMRLRIRRKVDLPQPDGPISAVTFPGSMVREIRSSTLLEPNQALTPVARSVDCPRAGSGDPASVGAGAAPASRVRSKVVIASHPLGTGRLRPMHRPVRSHEPMVRRPARRWRRHRANTPARRNVTPMPMSGARSGPPVNARVGELAPVVPLSPVPEVSLAPEPTCSSRPGRAGRCGGRGLDPVP